MRRHLRIIIAAAVGLAAASVPASAQLPDGTGTAETRRTNLGIAEHVREASLRFGLPEEWIYAVIRVESAGRVRAVSSAGAMGLMQLMPGTWQDRRRLLSLGPDPFDPRDNILAGTSYLREMYDRFGRACFLAAYNAGPGRCRQWLAGRRALPAETRRYVARLESMLFADMLFASPDQTVVSIAGRPDTDSSDSDSDAPAYPPVAPSPSHDLFVPVATTDDR